MSSSSSAISQLLLCFSSIHRRHRLPSRLYPYPYQPKEVLVVKSQEYVLRRTGVYSSDRNVTLNYTEDDAVVASHSDASETTYHDEHDDGKLTSEAIDGVVTEEKRAAKIHDFCFGIPFGALVLSGGIVGSIFSRNLATLGTGIFFGGALLALSTFSLKIWREGKSSLPFILGQAVLSAVLLWKNFQYYSMTKKIFPTGLYAVVSVLFCLFFTCNAAMLCFYTYVVMSGGNPPPKKLKPSAAAPS